MAKKKMEKKLDPVDAISKQLDDADLKILNEKAAALRPDEMPGSVIFAAVKTVAKTELKPGLDHVGLRILIEQAMEQDKAPGVE